MAGQPYVSRFPKSLNLQISLKAVRARGPIRGRRGAGIQLRPQVSDAAGLAAMPW